MSTTRRERIARSFFRSLIFGRFEPIETVLALSAFFHGLWLLFPDWSAATDAVAGARGAEVAIGILLAMFGVGHMLGMAINQYDVRKHSAFFMFVMWCFLTGLAVMAAGWASIIWVGYLTISLVSGLTYLNLSVGEDNGA